MLLSQEETRFPLVPTLTATLGVKGHRPEVGSRDNKGLERTQSQESQRVRPICIIWSNTLGILDFRLLMQKTVALRACRSFRSWFLTILLTRRQENGREGLTGDRGEDDEELT